MPYKDKSDRNYRKEYEQYDGTPAVKKRRAQRNKARHMMEKLGKVHKGDGKDVDHIIPETKGGKTVLSNLRVESAHDNRSYDRNSKHGLVSNKPFKKKK